MSDDTPESSQVAALEARVVDLEIRAAFQARTIEELDEVVRQFAGRVEALERAHAELVARTDLQGGLGPPGGARDLAEDAVER